jgi:hypothetical protein
MAEIPEATPNEAVECGLAALGRQLRGPLRIWWTAGVSNSRLERLPIHDQIGGLLGAVSDESSRG